MSSPNIAPPAPVVTPNTPLQLPSALADLRAGIGERFAIAREGHKAKSAQTQFDAYSDTVEVMDHEIRLFERLGAAAINSKPVYPVEDNGGELPTPRTRRQRKIDTKVWESKKKYMSTQGRSYISEQTERKSLGKQKRIQNWNDTQRIENDKTTTAYDKEMSLHDVEINPARRKSSKQKQLEKTGPKVSRKFNKATRKLSTLSQINKKENAAKKAVKKFDEVKQRTENKELLSIQREVNRVERTANKSTRKRSRKLNSETHNLNRERTIRSGLADRDRRITDLEASASTRREKFQLARTKKAREWAGNRADRHSSRADSARIAADRHLIDQNAGRRRAQEIRNYFHDLGEKNVITELQAVEALSYLDVTPASRRDRQVNDTLTSPNGKKYAKELRGLVAEHGNRIFIDIPDQAIQTMSDVLASHNLVPSAFGQSRSWFLWDVAKQLHYVHNPKDADPNYAVKDPLKSPSKMNEIIDRHVGWEVYREYTSLSDTDRSAFIASHGITANASLLLDKTPKDNGTLSSSELAQLGELLR